MSKNKKLYTKILFLLISTYCSAIFPLDLPTLCMLAAPHFGISLFIIVDKIISHDTPQKNSSCAQILDALNATSTQEALDTIAAIDAQYEQEKEELKERLHIHFNEIAQTLNSPTLQKYIEKIAQKNSDQFLSEEGIAAITKTINIVIRQRQLESILITNYVNQLHEIVSHVSATVYSPNVTLEKLKQAVPQSVPQPVLLKDLSDKEYKKLTGQL